MKLAIIDLGTNSVRFDIYKVDDSRSWRRIYREKQMVRLGDGVYRLGKLKQDAILRTTRAFTEFSARLTEFEVDKVVAFATCALRNSSNADEFIHKVKENAGIQLKVISGQKEAEMIALGVLENEKVPRGKHALIDIGGGSTEIILCEGRKILDSKSFALGANRLQQVFLKSSPPSQSSRIEELRSHVRETLRPYFDKKKWPEISQVLGSSGTIKAFRRIIKKSGGPVEPFKRKALTHWVEKMSHMTTLELGHIPGLDAKRVDMILAGGLLLDEALDVLGAKKVFTTEYSLRDGILQRELLKL